MLCLSGFELYSRWVPLTFKAGFFRDGPSQHMEDQKSFLIPLVILKFHRVWQYSTPLSCFANG